ncbi:MAG: hypothetical protein K0S65_2402 [Labilithrix sp.]|nr:hypothetical protein [Labilithrix sp.]
MSADAEVDGKDDVLEVGARLGQSLPREEEDVGQHDGLGVDGLAPGEGHQVIHDPMRQPGAPLDLRELRLTGSKVLPRQVDVRRDDLKRVAELVSNLSRDFADRREPLFSRGRVVSRPAAHG